MRIEGATEYIVVGVSGLFLSASNKCLQLQPVLTIMVCGILVFT